MALVQCWECGRDVSDAATACPHCGAPQNAAAADAQTTAEADEPPSKTCPFCHERFPVAAEVCRACGAWYGYSKATYSPRISGAIGLVLMLASAFVAVNSGLRAKWVIGWMVFGPLGFFMCVVAAYNLVRKDEGRRWWRHH